MENHHVIAIQILTSSAKSGGCATCGGSGVSQTFTEMLSAKTKELKETLESAYPGETNVTLVNIKDSDDGELSEARRLLESGEYPPPLVVINGEPRFAGYIAVDKIVHEVGKHLMK